MSKQVWGTFSVEDHCEPRAFVAEVMLFDRLVIPVPPDESRWTHEELLKEAVELSSDRSSQRKRASFWRWQREFFNDQGITDQTAIQEAVEEMRNLLEEENSVILKKGIHTATQFAFLAGSVVLGLIGGPLSHTSAVTKSLPLRANCGR